MGIDWDRVKKQTLWSYEDLLDKLQAVLGYRFVLQYYNHSMPQAQEYAQEIRRGYLQGRDDQTGFIDDIVASLEMLEA